MIRTLRLENSRGFKQYELRDLARVNLLVGPNDCGKTSVLEAVELLVSRGDPRALVESMRPGGSLTSHRMAVAARSTPCIVCFTVTTSVPEAA